MRRKTKFTSKTDEYTCYSCSFNFHLRIRLKYFSVNNVNAGRTIPDVKQNKGCVERDVTSISGCVITTYIDNTDKGISPWSFQNVYFNTT